MRCKYANNKCQKYEEISYTCNSYNAEDGYCGIYIDLEKEEEKKKQ